MEKFFKANSFAETKAKQALQLKPFISISLENIKDKLESILSHIGRNGIFKEYTKHDITHIDTMLKSLDWLIPDDTKEVLTSAEWLMIVLSIYFHDLGMLVTEKEFELREANTNYTAYKEKVIKGEFGTNFLKKIQGLKSGTDEFLYQEFVRRSHAERIKNWILNKQDQDYGSSDTVVEELRNMLGQIDGVFKKDLAMICESHHLDDLSDIQKYKLMQSYGTDANEQANLQYCAVLLRTADLLHITSDRTPSIEYRLISPNDPISQIEWSKQMAVKNVRPKYKVGKDGDLDRSVQPETIEVVAYFDEANKANSFFGLIDYLAYAKGQLSKSNKWITESNKRFALKYNFPWKDIDDSLIETEGFERKLFEFVLDQQKILNLLVGHTLYNDPTVVIREVVQNSIDAIKLHGHINQSLPNQGHIKIKWEQDDRILTFQDDGIGMTQEIIEKHLLKVGSSRYQDDSFKKEYPDFSAISRFGIGILTCFLIADDLDITTVNELEEKAKKISIRKVDGKYLLQHLEKSMVPEIGAHGTKIVLHVRQDVEFGNIEESLRKWILYPPCSVELNHNDKLTEIGFKSPKEALENQLKKLGIDIESDNIKVEQVQKDGVTMAFALRYSKFFNTWSFLEINLNSRNENHYVGTAVEGIRVEFTPPGYASLNLLVASNSTGRNAPTTNVARSHFEYNPEYTNYLTTVYDLYANHISLQIKNLISDSYSLTKAISEGYYIMSPLLAKENRDRTISPIDEELLIKSLLNIPAIAIESNGKRLTKSAAEVMQMDEIWTIESPQFRKAESFLEEVPGNVSTVALMTYINNSKIIEREAIFCNYRPQHLIHKRIFNAKTLDTIYVDLENRRIDLKWIEKDESLWITKLIKNQSQYSKEIQEQLYILQVGEIAMENLPPDTHLIITHGIMIILLNNPLHELIEDMIKLEGAILPIEENIYFAVRQMFFNIIDSATKTKWQMDLFEKRLQRNLREVSNEHDQFQEQFFRWVNKEKLASVLTSLSDHTLNFSYNSRTGRQFFYDF